MQALTMPAVVPSYNSQRVQGAQRFNVIEDVRLCQRLRLLDCEQRRLTRLSNQEMRMVGFSLEHINSSSGYSPEGLAPDQVLPEVEVEEEELFRYGERLVSRRFGKARRRPHSVMGGVGQRRSSASSGESLPANRPLSRPAKEPEACGSNGVFLTRPETPARSKTRRRAHSAVGYGFDRRRLSTSSGESLLSDRPLSSRSKNRESCGANGVFLTRSETPASSIISELGNGSALSDHTRPTSIVSARVRSKSRSRGRKKKAGFRSEATPVNTCGSGDEDANGAVADADLVVPFGKHRDFNYGRKSRLGQAVSEARVATAASRPSRHTSALQAWGTTTVVPVSARHRRVRQLKLDINHDRNRVVENRVQVFKHHNPDPASRRTGISCE